MPRRMSTWLLVSLTLSAQEPPPAAPRPVATAEATPAAATGPAIAWQRSLDDALAVQKATGLPLLICVNTDGEMFCDRFATTTYVDPAFVATTRGYVCVVASPSRHTKSDYDGLGRRIECPRFPGCTCSEHANIEPDLFARWFHGQRYAPRHVAVDVKGEVLFDHFLDRSMQDAVDDITSHKGTPAEAPMPTAATELLQRRDAAARRAVEALYSGGDAAQRRTLLGLAGKAANEPFDLLRLGLRDDDDAIFAAAAKALAATANANAGIDLQDAIARCDQGDLLAALETACRRVAAGDKAMAQFIAHRDAARAGIALAATGPLAAVTAPREPPPARDRDAVEAEVDAADAALKQAPTDVAARLRLARADLELALADAPGGGQMVPLVFEDARTLAVRALQDATTDGQRCEARAIAAVACWQKGDADAAKEHATAAMTALAVDAGAAVQPWFAAFLAVAGKTAAQAVYAAVQKDTTAVVRDDVERAAAAWSALGRHPFAVDTDLKEGAQLLAFAGARHEAQDLLAAAIARMPWSRELHDEWRRRLLADRGAEGLRATYARFVEAQGGDATAEWFAGYADIVAAETHVDDRRGEPALAAYTECVDRFRRSAAANPDFADSANHFAVLALAGRALARHLAGDGARAVEDLLLALQLRPASMGDSDGLGRKPEAIMRRIARELRERGETELAAKLPVGQ